MGSLANDVADSHTADLHIGREAHRSRPRRRPRPREGLLVPCGAGIVSMCSVRIAGLEMLSGRVFDVADPGLKPNG